MSREIYDNGFKPAIERAGYIPMRIDTKDDVVKIDDAIIAEIRRSRFLVADSTHGKEGARGGVDYEAGFAFGLGLPVIYTCREDMVDKIHFDTRQYHHTVWKTAEGLRESLKNRIVALIGESPKGLSERPFWDDGPVQSCREGHVETLIERDASRTLRDPPVSAPLSTGSS